jgi:Ni/Fe-hydrogenase 1 B-type cytochrome subunit
MAHLAHYKEAHPTPFVVTHWINAVAMVCMIITGFYIHYPLFGNWMGVARGLHIFLGCVILINCIVRVVLAFFVKSAPTGGTRETVPDYKTWLPQKDNRHQGPQWIKYYLFGRKTHPLSAKLGVPQKISYLVIPILILIMAFTGFCIWTPTMNIGPFYAFQELVGGIMVVHIIHYYLMWVFICFMMLHIYLATIEGLAPAKLMFFHKEHGGLVYSPEKHNIVGEDDMSDHEYKAPRPTTNVSKTN